MRNERGININVEEKLFTIRNQILAKEVAREMN